MWSYSFCFWGLGFLALISVLDALALLAEGPQLFVIVLVLLVELTLQLLDARFQLPDLGLFLSGCVFHLLHKHWDAIGVAGLDRLLKQSALLFQISGLTDLLLKLLCFFTKSK